MECARLLLLLLPLLLYPGAQVQLAGGADASVPAVGLSPGCATWCGDIDVPFPFGLDPQCAIHSNFVLSCTSVNGATKLFHGDLEVIKVSVQDGKSWLKTRTAQLCYDRANHMLDYNNVYLDLGDLPYVLSANDNKVIVLGCDSLAYMRSDSYIIGCSTTCDDDDGAQPSKNGSCSSTAGCCQVDLPRGVSYYRTYFNQLYNNSDPGLAATPCNYVTVMERAAFNFSTTYLTTAEFGDADEHRIPVVMEWGVSRKTCEEARVDKETPYACVSSNSDCVVNDFGYLCNCSTGYRGNPYVVGGCTDIDECHERLNPCDGICTNTPGFFHCSCPKGKTMINDLCVKNHRSVLIDSVVGVSVGLVVLVIATTCAYSIRERRNLDRIKKKNFQQYGGMILFEEMKSQQGLAFKIFPEEDLQHATSMFDEKNVIGHGGHGKVYKGALKNDAQVAVKRCMIIDEQQKKEFGREMLILSQVNHKNIVKLLGCCLEVEVPMLVYEFIPNGTLFQLIHGGRHISLATRLRIVHESAEALSYLHSCASPPILHGDVKSTNILIDGDYTAKVSDFGASIHAPTDKSQFVTIVQGTCGYLDPEYMQTCQLTDKSDVYSFGVVLLELLTRKEAFNLNGPENEKSLSMVFLSAMNNNRLMDILDDQIKKDENAEILEEIADLAKQCLEISGVNRPSMKEVADRLDILRKVMQHPRTPVNPEELYSLLGESSTANTAVVTTEGFTTATAKKAALSLETGR